MVGKHVRKSDLPLRGTAGFTMVETLVVVAIIAIMGGLVVMSIFNAQKNLYQLEMDGNAKEIYIAAQNHLTAAESEGVLEVMSKGTADADAAEGDGVYYFVYAGRSDASSYYGLEGKSMLKQMLPFGAIDDTVRISGSYVIRYQITNEAVRVLDVFYADPSGSDFGGRFKHTFSSSEYATLVANCKGSENNETRRDFDGDGAIIGWWGDDGAGELEVNGGELKAPVIKVENAERLRVIVADRNSVTEANSWSNLRFEVKGATSGAVMSVSLNTVLPTGGKTYGTYDFRSGSGSAGQVYVVDLDDVSNSQATKYNSTFAKSAHFADIANSYYDATAGKMFIPGEDLEICAIADTTQRIAAEKRSATIVANSLFDSVAEVTPAEGEQATHQAVMISSVRHLENLSYVISGYRAERLTSGLAVKAGEGSLQVAGLTAPTGQALTVAQLAAMAEGESDVLPVTGAVQLNDLSWNNYRYALLDDNFDEAVGELQATATDAATGQQTTVATKLTSVAIASRTAQADAAALFITAAGGGQLSPAGSFAPITYATASNSADVDTFVLNYDGSTFRIADVVVSGQGQAGLFASLSGGSVKDVALVNFDISASDAALDNSVENTAGALAATSAGTDISGVLAYNEPAEGETDEGLAITGGSSAGGLVGAMAGGSIDQCAAALYVRTQSGSASTAGGLVGVVRANTAEGSASISNSYSGGHTQNGTYTLATDAPRNANVYAPGGMAGGLVGSAEGATIEYCYSTCSAAGAVAGGLAGNLEGGSATNSYATGKVLGSSSRGAIAGVSTAAFEACQYLDIINHDQTDASGRQLVKGVGGQDPDGVFAADVARDGKAAITSYNEFAPQLQPAVPYDPVLSSWYNGRYPLKTIAALHPGVVSAADDDGGGLGQAGDSGQADAAAQAQDADQAKLVVHLGTHYGDWPSYETFVVNTN